MNIIPDSDFLIQVVANFEFDHCVTDIAPDGSGHIHDTFRVKTSDGADDLILQRINHEVFKDVPNVMDNIARVTAHIRNKMTASPDADLARCTLSIIETRDGLSCYRDDDENWWRVFSCIPGAHTRDVIDEPRHAFESGRAFASFQGMLVDLPDPPLHETIPFFHHTPKRFEALVDAIEQDPLNRAADCQPEIAFALERQDNSHFAEDGLEDGTIPRRVTHNDTKINNVMLDDNSGHFVCVIDLDTVMPGTVLYDFGDQVRTSVGHFEENEKDLSRVNVDMALFEQLVSGYLSVAGGFLVDRECELLCAAASLITGENGVRFLTDYLVGDTYFKIHYPGENLDRARTQFRFVEKQEEHRDPMESIVSKYRET